MAPFGSKITGRHGDKWLEWQNTGGRPGIGDRVTIWWPYTTWAQITELQIEYGPLQGVDTWAGETQLATATSSVSGQSGAISINKMFDGDESTFWGSVGQDSNPKVYVDFVSILSIFEVRLTCKQDSCGNGKYDAMRVLVGMKSGSQHRQFGPQLQGKSGEKLLTWKQSFPIVGNRVTIWWVQRTQAQIAELRIDFAALGAANTEPEKFTMSIPLPSGIKNGDQLMKSAGMVDALGREWPIQKRPSESIQNFYPHSFSPCPV